MLVIVSLLTYVIFLVRVKIIFYKFFYVSTFICSVLHKLFARIPVASPWTEIGYLTQKVAPSSLWRNGVLQGGFVGIFDNSNIENWFDAFLSKVKCNFLSCYQRQVSEISCERSYAKFSIYSITYLICPFYFYYYIRR